MGRGRPEEKLKPGRKLLPAAKLKLLYIGLSPSPSFVRLSLIGYGRQLEAKCF